MTSTSKLDSPIAQLTQGAVHVWFAAVGEFWTGRSFEQLWDCLSDAEQTRAQRFVFDRHRREYVVAHAMLRTVVGHHAGVDPRSLKFETLTHGKPVLAGQYAGSAVHFNLSHTDGMAVVACTAAGPIGVDVEECGRLISCDVAKKVLHNG